VPYNASDPDGDPLTATASSDNPGVVGAVVNVPGAITLTGIAPGMGTIVLSVSDGINPPVEVSFTATVNAANNPPTIQPIADQTLNAGDTLNVPVVASDPDGDPLALVAASQDNGVVIAQAVGVDTVQLQGGAAGVTVVDVTADDAHGGVVTVSFTVTVSSAPSGFDLWAYPVIPEISPAMAQSLNQLYQSGVTNFGNRAGVFVRIGDETMDGPNFMAPFATPGAYNLDSYGTLQATIDFFGATPIRDSGENSFNADSLAAGPDYGLETLATPAPGGSPCDAIGGGTLLSCELQLDRGSIALVSFSAQNVAYLPPEQFRAELQALVTDLLSNYGVIPVLATIPEGGGYTSDQLLPYNQAIVEVAQNAGIAGVPLWNLWRAMQESGVGDPNSVAPAGPADFSAASLSFGYNVRNLTALQALEQVRQAVGIN